MIAFIGESNTTPPKSNTTPSYGRAAWEQMRHRNTLTCEAHERVNRIQTGGNNNTQREWHTKPTQKIEAQTQTDTYWPVCKLPVPALTGRESSSPTRSLRVAHEHTREKPRRGQWARTQRLTQERIHLCQRHFPAIKLVLHRAEKRQVRLRVRVSASVQGRTRRLTRTCSYADIRSIFIHSCGLHQQQTQEHAGSRAAQR